ncbi:uncharacterized protein LOC144354101 [Saccoglossus kowalevskii]
MLLILYISLLLHTVGVVSQPSIPPPGVSYLGVGYNILDGNPMGRKEVNGGLDPGIRIENRVFELTFDEGYLSDNLLYLRPDQVEYDITDTCSFVQNDYVIWGTDSYQANIISAIHRSGETIHSAGYEFTESDLFNAVNMNCNVNDDVLYEDRFICDRGTARYQTENVQTLEYPLSNDFASAVCSLPTDYNEATYMSFLDTWGTDVIVEVSVGTKLSNIYSSGRRDFCFFAYEYFASTVSYGGPYNGFTDSVIVDMNSFETQVSAPFGSLQTNMQTGSDNLDEPIAIKVISIDSILDTRYWSLVCQYVVDGACELEDIAALTLRKSNLAQALLGYASWRNAPTPSDPSVQTEVTWPSGTYGFPEPNAGCPSSSGFSWARGWRDHDTEDVAADNDWSNPYDLRGPYGHNNMRQNFCVKTTNIATAADWQWARGEYCVFKKGSCPTVYWDCEDIGSASSKGGFHPYENGGSDDHRLHYCYYT